MLTLNNADDLDVFVNTECYNIIKKKRKISCSMPNIVIFVKKKVLASSANYTSYYIFFAKSLFHIKSKKVAAIFFKLATIKI
jgi:hypothetical protein